ncbi:MAG: 3-hydroxyacyl-CoA dehydrogenase family protein [Bacillota bacterium]
MHVGDIKRICVLGCGNMGSYIAANAAIHGFEVVSVDVKEEVVAGAAAFTARYLQKRVRNNLLTEDEARGATQRLSHTTDLTAGAARADFVIEAVPERLELKRKVFAELDRLCRADVVLATNSSFIVSSKIADATGRPDRVVNMHFFGLDMELVEVVQGPHVSDATARLTMDVATKMGKTPLLLKKEVYGFLVNRILGAILNESLWLADMKVATPEDIDTAVTKALGHPVGPFRLMDMIGLDLVYDIAMERYGETGDPKEKPSPLVVEKVTKGQYGRKSGQGWYEYKA